ncbi:chemotaxis protein CheX [Heliobacterium gestii]|uniref:Chemotaxis protein CheX n=1 Tax=Heliomicrobium gestii TaxID=2699 RepID=A0A845L8R9_HELGE|nr:chemotaxis protein CheX [Heliomicrobium gestii]MBM7866075.1 chemotaxis protein CheX [Heliomicrobium gestii]MZP42598.1 chemotaxis protein CheX [Heliomicrobium gestii]
MDQRMTKPFSDAVVNIFRQMADIDVEIESGPAQDSDEIRSLGVTSILTFAGKVKGRFLLDLDSDLALHVAKTLIGGEYDSVKDHMVLASVSEMNNIISGNAITQLNNEYSLSLRLAPPIVFAGNDVIIAIPKIASISVNFKTAHGRLKASMAISKA